MVYYDYKNDKGKLEWDLLPLRSVKEIIKVLEYGKNKYSKNSWMQVEDWDLRYFNSVMRHIMAWKEGETMDKESNLPHLIHAITNLIFIYELENTKMLFTEEQDEI